MVDTAEQMGKKLMIGQNQRFAKAHAEAKKSSSVEISEAFLLLKQHSDMVARKHGV